MGRGRARTARLRKEADHHLNSRPCASKRAVMSDASRGNAEDAPVVHRKYGWKRDKLPNDMVIRRTYRAPHHSNLPPVVSLYDGMPAPVQQGPLNACTACAAMAALRYCERQAGVDADTKSLLFLYYNSRVLDGNGAELEDNGASLYNCLESVRTKGVCRDDLWPYDTSRFAAKPPMIAYIDALDGLTGVLQFERVSQDKWSVEACLYNKRPVIFGIVAYESLETPEVEKTGDIPMPKEDELPLGGHALVIFGYDSTRRVMNIMNSWGPEWGSRSMPGTGTIPYAYVLNSAMANDLWTCRYLPLPPMDMTPSGLMPTAPALPPLLSTGDGRAALATTQVTATVTTNSIVDGTLTSSSGLIPTAPPLATALVMATVTTNSIVDGTLTSCSAIAQGLLTMLPGTLTTPPGGVATGQPARVFATVGADAAMGAAASSISAALQQLCVRPAPQTASSPAGSDGNTQTLSQSAVTPLLSQ
jgi:hypothetical protein